MAIRSLDSDGSSSCVAWWRSSTYVAGKPRVLAMEYMLSFRRLSWWLSRRPVTNLKGMSDRNDHMGFELAISIDRYWLNSRSIATEHSLRENCDRINMGLTFTWLPVSRARCI